MSSSTLLYSILAHLFSFSSLGAILSLYIIARQYYKNARHGSSNPVFRESSPGKLRGSTLYLHQHPKRRKERAHRNTEKEKEVTTPNCSHAMEQSHEMPNDVYRYANAVRKGTAMIYKGAIYVMN
jgi:hypothetical protein